MMLSKNIKMTDKIVVLISHLLVELKATKTHTQIFKVNRREFYCVVELPLSDYPLYGKQLVARG